MTRKRLHVWRPFGRFLPLYHGRCSCGEEWTNLPTTAVLYRLGENHVRDARLAEQLTAATPSAPDARQPARQ